MKVLRPMYDSEFDAPPTFWVVATVVGGIATGLGLVISLEYLGDRLSANRTTGQKNVFSIVRNPIVRK